MLTVSVMSRIVLSAEQKLKLAELMAGGFTRSQARWEVMTPEQKRGWQQQTRDAEKKRYRDDPYHEIVAQARNSAKSAWRRGAKHGAHRFTITEEDLDWPPYCPVFPWIKLHYPGHHLLDPAGASLERLNTKIGYVPDNVIVVSLRANLLRKDATPQELEALAKFYGRLELSNGDFDSSDGSEVEYGEECDLPDDRDHPEPGDEFQDPEIIPDGEIMPDEVK
jgi:hypothetical protein